MTLSATAPSRRVRTLVVTVAGRACALPLVHVEETMRPLPTSSLAGVPQFVLGVAVIRGAPVPVVDLAAVIGAGTSDEVSRFVTLRLGERRVALAVEAVLGLRDLDAARVDQMPPLLRGACAGVVAAIGTLDQELLLVLRSSRIAPDDLWQELETRGAPA
jgi:purine-binding chemotaxis protein CheW